MSETRLIEITSNISSIDGPLAVMTYLASLNYSDIYLLLRYVGSSKYSGMNFCDAVVEFSRNYLMSKNIIINPEVVDFMENQAPRSKNPSDKEDIVEYARRVLTSSDSTIGRKR